MKKMEMAACILAASKASLSPPVFDHVIISAPVRAALPPSMALFITMAIAAGILARFLWNICATFCTQHFSVLPSVSVSQVQRVSGLLHHRAGPPPYRTVGMLPCSHVGAPPNFPGGDSAAGTAGMRQKKSWIPILIALVSISAFALRSWSPMIYYSVHVLPPAPSLLRCGDVEANPGPQTSVSAVATDGIPSSSGHATHTDHVEAQSQNPPTASSGELRSYFATPATHPKSARRFVHGGTVTPAPPIVAAMPPLASDSDTSDDDTAPIKHQLGHSYWRCVGVVPRVSSRLDCSSRTSPLAQQARARHWIDGFLRANDIHVGMFGRTAFTTDWHEDLP